MTKKVYCKDCEHFRDRFIPGIVILMLAVACVFAMENTNIIWSLIFFLLMLVCVFTGSSMVASRHKCFKKIDSFLKKEANKCLTCDEANKNNNCKHYKKKVTG